MSTRDLSNDAASDSRSAADIRRRTGRSTRSRVKWLPVALTAVVSMAAAQEVAPLSTLDGVYTAQQARRGEASFVRQCMDCHELAEFTGAEALFETEAGNTLWPIFDFMWSEMPEDQPAWLDPEEYADILAYLLEQYGMPAGGAELPPEPDYLRTITLESAATDGS